MALGKHIPNTTNPFQMLPAYVLLNLIIGLIVKLFEISG